MAKQRIGMGIGPAFGRRLLMGLLIGTLAQPAWSASDSLPELIQRALVTHPLLVSARATATAQEARARGASSPFWPQVSISSGVSQTTAVSQAQNTSQPFNLLQGGLNVRQQLWDFGRTADEMAAAEAAAESSRQQALLQAVDVAFGVRRAFVDCLRADGLFAQSQARLKAAETLHAQAQAFWKAGRRPKIDVTRAEASLLQAKADVVTAHNTAQGARITLAAAVGNTAPVTVSGPFPAPPAMASLPADRLLILADQHPNVVVAHSRLRQLDAQVRLADKTHWPDIVADGNYGVRARDLAPSQNWSAGVSMNMPLFSGFADTRQQETATAQVQAGQAELRQQEIQVRAVVSRAALTLEGARQRFEALGGASRSALENLALAEGRYRVGVGSVIEVSDAQTLAANAQAELVRAEADYHLAIAELLRAVGRTGVES